MLYIKFGQDNPSSFREETENILMLMHDDGQKRIAKDDSGYLHVKKKTFLRWAKIKKNCLSMNTSDTVY